MFLFRKYQDEHERKVAQFLKSILGIRPKNVDFYNMALIHRSASDSTIVEGHFVNNERLEFLGDAVLDAIIGEYLFRKFPFKPEGELTEMRSKLVCRERLGMLSRKLHLEEIITINPHAHAKCAGGDAFEALVGALFLDKGYNKTKNIVLKKLFFPFLDVDAVLEEESNFKSKIINWAQKQHKKVTFDHEVAENQRDRKLYRVKLMMDGKVIAEGLDYTVKKAEKVAAERACEKLCPKETE